MQVKTLNFKDNFAVKSSKAKVMFVKITFIMNTNNTTINYKHLHHKTYLLATGIYLHYINYSLGLLSSSAKTGIAMSEREHKANKRNLLEKVDWY